MMKRARSFFPDKHRAVVALASVVAPALLWAQVSLYGYSESVETYTEITSADGGYSMGTPTFWPPYHNLRAFVDPANPDGVITNGGYLGAATGPGYPIGFDFLYNGDVFDRIGIAHGGWISFGKSSDGNQAVWTYTSDHPHGRPFVQSIGGPSEPYKRNRIAGWGDSELRMQDMTSLIPPGPISSLRVATIGTAPDRVCVIQWKDFRNSYSSTGTLINFQIRLNESDNSVEVRFGNVIFASSGGTAQVGLSGRVPEDFNSRVTPYEQPAFLYDWNLTAAATANTEGCTVAATQPGQPNGSGIPPVLGRNFKWTPLTCPPPAWPLTIGEVTFQSALVTWQPTGAEAYEYFVSTENDINGPEVTSGTTPDPEAVIEGLDPRTTYYVFVRGICGGEPGTWSLGTLIRTQGGGFVVCDGTAVHETYCSHQFDVVYWSYVSEDGSPLKIEFQGGVAGNNAFEMWNGPIDSGADFTASGDITGQTFLASTGQISIRLTTDAGSCETQPWYYPFNWKVGCKNCTDPLVQFSLGDVDCDAQEFYVNADIFSLGSSATLLLENDLGLPAATVSTTGVHAVGPFPAGDPVTITAQNPDNEMCYSAAAPLVNAPCAIVGCEPTWYTRCAQPNETRDWLLQGDGQPISVRFPPVYLGWDAELIVYDGADELSPSQTITVNGQADNQVVTSTNAEHMLLVRLIASQFPDYACSEGNGSPLEFVAACSDGCEQPTATFAYADCTSPTTFSVVVNVTDLGSTGSVTITNDGGAPDVVANAVGAYTVGPFPSASVVELNVEGANDVCTWTSSSLSKDCSTMGVTEASQPGIALFPNPNDGQFTLELPQDMSGATDLLVADLSGRVVAQHRLLGTGRVGVDLSQLPNGLYTLTLRNNEKTANGRISIQH
ncbi:MAG: T9SS type A sorting domain-containing protein [Bacteroidetes bacterium]|nr:T9SS type A sorting domain-containing protein [Bacteroidota bacterium]